MELDKRKVFEELAKPLMDFIYKYGGRHDKIIISVEEATYNVCDTAMQSFVGRLRVPLSCLVIEEVVKCLYSAKQ